MSFTSNNKAINKNNGSLATLEGFQNSYFWNDYGYNNTKLITDDAYKNDKKAYAQAVIRNQVEPLLKQAQNWDDTHSKLGTNYTSITSDYDKMVLLRDQLNEVPPYESVTVEVGPSPMNNVKIIDYTDLDPSYQRIAVEPIVDSTNEASSGADFPAEGMFKVSVDGMTITVEKTAPLPGQEAAGSTVQYSDGWTENLKINIKIESIPDKKYYHHTDDWELGETRKNQREQHMWDTKELLLYTNQFYIIGSITTALALIFAYKRYG